MIYFRISLIFALIFVASCVNKMEKLSTDLIQSGSGKFNIRSPKPPRFRDPLGLCVKLTSEDYKMNPLKKFLVVMWGPATSCTIIGYEYREVVEKLYVEKHTCIYVRTEQEVRSLFKPKPLQYDVNARCSQVFDHPFFKKQEVKYLPKLQLGMNLTRRIVTFATNQSAAAEPGITFFQTMMICSYQMPSPEDKDKMLFGNVYVSRGVGRNSVFIYEDCDTIRTVTPSYVSFGPYEERLVPDYSRRWDCNTSTSSASSSPPGSPFATVSEETYAGGSGGSSASMELREDCVYLLGHIDFDEMSNNNNNCNSERRERQITFYHRKYKYSKSRGPLCRNIRLL